MIKKFIISLCLAGWAITANAADLVQVYIDAVLNDPIYKQAVGQRLAD